ncbi:PREDICTED: LOW QUALITY PROTEIN: MPN domain-containing protein [Calidris pugnax]|uniref:LOW QUALITY PROTEIN: MPN domain-containing protein n=1 Tax=Calidris pugnax TaxID=198806 RepID=UPI00071D4136|nr:PREDICTED: LOW QUALITY PROTEIN: MPN domain-containing protein [Calidris pugnax]
MRTPTPTQVHGHGGTPPTVRTAGRPRSGGGHTARDTPGTPRSAGGRLPRRGRVPGGGRGRAGAGAGGGGGRGGGGERGEGGGGHPGGVLTRRGITLRVLLRDGLLEPARGVLSIYYLEEEMPEEEEEEAMKEGRAPVPAPAAAKKPEERSKKQQCKSLVEPTGTDHGPPGKRPESKPRVPVRYCTLGTRDSARNPQTLVEVTSFAAINKFQPFNVAISSNVLLLLDFHSHLTRSEVVGYLGGRWDTNTQLLTVLRAFPCRTRLGDAEAAGAVEEEICQSLFLRGLSLVGWYHSHPFGPALPSLHDIDAQMDYQLKLQGSGNGFQPCLALICGPYYHGNPGVESKIAPFWVMPPPEQRPNDYGIPMDVEVAYIQDGFLTNDVLQEMTLLVEFYKGAPDLVKFQELWSQDQTYLDKLKGSLASRTPKDQSFTHILEQIYSLLKLSG